MALQEPQSVAKLERPEPDLPSAGVSGASEPQYSQTDSRDFRATASESSAFVSPALIRMFMFRQ